MRESASIPSRLVALPLILLFYASALAAPPAREGTWAFNPPADQFTDDALLDLRYLNEKQSGEHGFIRLSDNGEDFVNGDGQAIRFFAVNSDGPKMTPDEMDRHARFLAKLGVNMVRIHAMICDSRDGAAITDVNEKQIQGIFRFVKACKDNGIYVTLSPFWPYAKAPASWGLDGVKPGEQVWGLIFFNPKLQAGYKAWVKELYTRENPHTGLTLANDPTVAIIQVMNEDSLLFWTINKMPEAQKMILGQRFATWLRKRYGSLDKARSAWGRRQAFEGIKDDEKDSGGSGGHVVLLNLWDLTQAQQGDKATRVRDQLQFLAETQKGFYEDMGTYYRKTLDCRQVINAMNWKSADNVQLGDAERWTYGGLEVMAVNRYFGSTHEGDNASWRIEPGHLLRDASALRNPLKMPTNLKQVAGKPFVISESTWVHPNVYQSEGPLLMAAYQSLTGIDGFYWFAMNKPTWNDDPTMSFFNVKGQHPWFKWTASVPQLAGMFPANALLYRQGYLKRGQPVVIEERSLDQLWDRKPSLIAENETFDPLRDETDLSGAKGGAGEQVSRLAFLVGPVQWKPEGAPATSKVADLSPYIDAKRKTVVSNTGQITLNYETGLCTVNAPNAQGVTGFLHDAGGKFALDDVTIESENHYATIQIVSMDGKPLRESRKVLVQAGTTARLTGWRTRPAEGGGKPGVDGSGNEPLQEIVNVGQAPWRIANLDATITLNNPHLTRATLLDAGGYTAADVPVKMEGGQITLTLPRYTMWLILEP